MGSELELELEVAKVVLNYPKIYTEKVLNQWPISLAKQEQIQKWHG